MKNSKAAYIVQKARRTVEISDYEIINMTKYINIVVEYIKNVAKQKNIDNKEELKEFILDKLYEEMEEYCTISNIKGRFFQLEASKRIIEDKSIIESVYSTIKDDERYTEGYSGEKTIIYNFNFRNNCRHLIGENLGAIRAVDALINPEERKLIESYSRSNEFDKRRMEKTLGSKVDIEKLKMISEILKGSIQERIYNQINDCIQFQEEELKEELIKVMQFLYSKFQEYGFLERYKKDNDRNMAKAGLKNYTYEISTGKHSKEEIGIEELFSREFLETQDIEDIIILCTFWQNRYSKEKMQIGEAIFAIDTLDLWDKILDGDKTEISDEEIEGVYNKTKCVKELCSSLFINLRGKHRDTLREDSEKGFQVIDDTAEIDKIVSQESKNYRQIFNGILFTSSNDLYDDIMGYKPILNHVENIYQIRNSMLGCKIRLLLNSKKCKNWGVIQEEKNDNDPYILIGIDYEGFNMPIRLHIKKEFLIEILRDYNKETKVPIYEGDRDFIINSELIPTNILMPLQKRQKNAVKEEFSNIQEESDRTKFIKHLRFLANHDKYPEHLKVETHTSKGIKKVRLPRRYIDLVTGEIFEKENGEYVITLDGRGEDDYNGGR